MWELRRQGKSRYKSLTKAQCEAIERDYQLYKREVAIGKRTQSRRCILTESGSKRIQMDIGKTKKKTVQKHETFNLIICNVWKLRKFDFTSVPPKLKFRSKSIELVRPNLSVNLPKH